MYNSPLRKDKNASFSVSTRLNLWKDFGTQFAGNVIDLVIALKGNCSFREAVAWLKQQAGNPEDETSSPNTSRPQEHNASIMSGNSNMSDMRVKELSSPVLLKYLESRGIPAGIARRYCKEAHYTVRDREYYAIAFMNILGGMELRCQYFKGCHGVSRTGCRLLKDRLQQRVSLFAAHAVLDNLAVGAEEEKVRDAVHVILLG